MDIFYYVSMAVGAIAVLTACYMGIAKKQVGTFGITMLVAGLVMVALPVSKNIIISIGDVQVTVQRLMNNVGTLDANIQNIQQANQLLTTEVEKVISSQNISRQAFSNLVVNLQQQANLTPGTAREIIRPLRSVQPSTLENVRSADRILREIRPIDP